MISTIFLASVKQLQKKKEKIVRNDIISSIQTYIEFTQNECPG